MTGTDDSDPLIPGALFWHLAPPCFAGWNRYAICTSPEIRDKLRSLGPPGLSERCALSKQQSEGKTAIELEMTGRTTVEETDSWKILLMCWQFASILADKFSDPYLHTSASGPRYLGPDPDGKCCGVYRFLVGIKSSVRRGLAKVCQLCTS